MRLYFVLFAIVAAKKFNLRNRKNSKIKKKRWKTKSCCLKVRHEKCWGIRVVNFTHDLLHVNFYSLNMPI